MPPDDPPPPPPPFEQLLAHPDVRAAVHRVLRRFGVAAQDLDDGYQDVLEAAVGWKTDHRPTTLNGVIALCVHIARKQAITKLRKRKRRQAKGDEGVIDPAEVEVMIDDRQWDRLDYRHELEAVIQDVPQDVRAMFADRAMGLSDQEIADKKGISVAQVRAMFNKWRVTIRRTAEGAGAATILIVAWLFLRGHLEPDGGRVSHPAPDFSEETAPPPPPLPSGTPVQQAATLRDQARAACAAKKWKECLTAYDLAQRLDPQGETPEVEKAHAEALEAVRKHGSGE
jgi:DNA-directed RNA polymerase specialized sigma24 family protein